MRYFTFIILVLSLSMLQCSTKQEKTSTPKELNFSIDKNFGSYWYQGSAELTSYHLTQIRYGQEREGDAVLVFVTEDFSRSKQVKLDNPEQAGEDAEKVLKLNFTKKFQTGIYPYSIMSSVFSPVYPTSDLHLRKLTTSIQEWCGQIFIQLNTKGNSYNLQNRSYFESEGDFDKNLDKMWIEDELWNLIRLDPSAIPTGEVDMLPSTQFLRLKHKTMEAQKARLSIESVNDSINTLTVEFPDLQRTLKIQYAQDFPYQIQSWQESYPEGGNVMTTEAVLNKRIQLDYWNKNSVADSIYRKKLDLSVK